MRLNLKSIEERVAPLGRRESYDREFIFDLLQAYGKPQGNITRLRMGSLNVADAPETEVAQKNVVYFKETTDDPLAVIDELKTAPTVVRYNTRFVIVTDYVELLAVDTKTGENLMIPIRDIDQHFTFFLPWAGMEKAQYVAEAHADVKAAERMGKLFDELLAANPDLLELPHGRHGLNVFFTRLLFCFFAEDTSIFEENQFTNAIGSHTQADGSDVADFLTNLFEALDTIESGDKAQYLAGFPYVNGRLFRMAPDVVVPRFTKKARQYLIESGSLIWREINPDIFGSMFQAIVTPGKRSDLGQHYTSVPNILKTIEPLFLDNLKEQFDAGFDSVKKLERLLDRISEIKIFDPACGSGNFLVIAYKELRKLEHAILERLADLDPKHQVLFAESRINIESFYGIEIDDFAVEIAILSLWIAKHQMNTEFKEKFNLSIPLIPLKEAGQVHAGNAARVDWKSVCPNDGSEIYLIGNPPYSGAMRQLASQKQDYRFVFRDRPYSGNLDYISLWFVKGVDYIEGTRAELAFVTTKTVAQGEHAGLLFPMIFDKDIEIGFAYPGFQWDNNAKTNADVTVAVIGLRCARNGPKFLYTDGLQISAKSINAYLTDGPNIFLTKRKDQISGLPPMSYGSMANDDGALVLTSIERARIVGSNRKLASIVKRYLGAYEFLTDTERYTLWIEADELAEAMTNEEVASRIERVRRYRESSARASTKKLAQSPYRFGEVRYKPKVSIIVPKVSSGRREYIPVGYLDPDVVVNGSALSIYDAAPWTFALLCSRTHMTWVNAVAGRMRINYQYSNTIVYNNFPVPPLSDSLKDKLTVAALRVLDVREYHCEKTLAELYDPDEMPEDLRQAHAEIDTLVDSIYSKRGYETDEQRLSDLFAMYEAMTVEEVPKPPAKKRGCAPVNVIKKPINIVDVTYARTGGSVTTDALGMREMQQRVFAKRDAQHLLVKAPPASGKSRALMFVGLDKLYNQGRKKVIVAVPERSIGASFASTKLTEHGFFADWEVKPEHNLCDPGSSQGKVGAFIDFLNGPDAILVSTHATLRFAFEKLSPDAFDGTVLAIDEFHHVSADTEASRLGALLREVMNGSDVHIVAMTGSYFRGDSVPVLSADDESKFTPVTFNYYDQLNGYEHLHSLGIGHHFYQGRYTDAIGEVFDLDKKTIIHIPNVNSGESTKDKIEEVGFIIDSIGQVEDTDPDTGIISIRRSDTGAILRVADLVDDTDQKKRADTLHYLTTVASKDRDAVDVIIALGMAKEGFDWPFAEHALTVAYRASLTEVIQIIGRVTRDSPGKEHAQFTNLIAEPDASQGEVKVSVNNMLKAITASLLMEQVLAQNFTFKTKHPGEGGAPPPGVITIRGFKEPSTDRVKQIVETDLNDLKATILQDDTFAKAAAGSVDPETTNKVLIPKIIRERYPDLDESQVEELRQQVVVDSVIKNGEVREVGDKRFIKMSEKFVNIDDVNINLIDSVNPFQRAFEVMSKSVTPSVLRIISDAITATRIEFTDEEAFALFPKIQQWAKVNGRKPDARSEHPTEKRYAEALLYLQRRKQQHLAEQRGTQTDEES